MPNQLALKATKAATISHRNRLSIDEARHTEVFYDAGATTVLRDMGKMALQTRDFDVEAIADAEDSHDKHLKALTSLLATLPKQHLKAVEVVIQSAEYAYSKTLDGGFVDGFIAGYIYLKNVSPD